jgi:hypothetical protein
VSVWLTHLAFVAGEDGREDGGEFGGEVAVGVGAGLVRVEGAFGCGEEAAELAGPRFGEPAAEVEGEDVTGGGLDAFAGGDVEGPVREWEGVVAFAASAPGGAFEELRPVGGAVEGKGNGRRRWISSAQNSVFRVGWRNGRESLARDRRVGQRVAWVVA